MDQFRTVFFEECADLLATAENHLSKLSHGDYDIEDIHAIFRAVHSVKGGAGSFGFDTLIDFSHTFETALDILRDAPALLESTLIDVFLRANDILGILVQNAENNRDGAPEAMAFIKQQLFDFIQHKKGNASPQGPSSTQSSQENQRVQSFTLSFIPELDLMRFGNEPYLILRELKRLSVNSSFHVTAQLERLPSILDFNPEHCYLKWSISLDTENSKEAVKECFDFVEDDCVLTFTTREAHSTPLSSSSTSSKNASILTPPISSAPDKTAQPKADMPAPVPQPNQSPTEQTVHSIRVELDRIDRLVNTVGEMVIKQAMLLDAAVTLKNSKQEGNYNNLTKGLEELTQHTRELQESVMAIRAQPVKAVFARMPRLVREIAAQLQKEVRVEMSGENTEIDKTVIERLGEPLTHMMRNAVDHGIEIPEERIQKGKPSLGTIHLNASHQSGRIVIQIIDDGGGINREKVLEKAKAAGIVAEDVTLSGEEIDQLIFHPGFSTASQVTNISGRGVGMDVVKKSIQSLGGRINIQSVEGQGCTFTMLLPLTLAVLDGMIVTVGRECYVIPLIHILETLRPSPSQVHPLVGGTDLLDLRQKNIPLVYLHKIFNISGAIKDPTQGIIVVMETEGGDHIGLVVDEIVTQQQVVLKSLEANYDPIPGISAATILGNGRVSLILDVNMLRKI